MDADNCALAAGIVSKAYINQGQQALSRHKKSIKTLLSQRRLPSKGWDDSTIELFLQEVALMDSNNFLDNVGVGEREARVASSLVSRRHYRLAHGIGRSGEVNAEQPKAAGSSLLLKLTNSLAADALSLAGLKELGPILVLPLSTGMALTVTLLGLRATLKPQAKYVVWPRIDQKTCLKCITAAGFIPIIVPLRANGDQLETDVDAVQQKIEEYGGPESIACVLTTTSCFAPRAADDVVAIGKLCQRLDIAHIVNNAYGVQSATLCAMLTSAWRKGRVDAIVQSTDKNFMVPVGGAIIAAPANRPQLIDRVNSLYPGRASASPIIDLLITLLHWGSEGWQTLLTQRELLYSNTRTKLINFAERLGERVLETPGNPISLGMTLRTLTHFETPNQDQDDKEKDNNNNSKTTNSEPSKCENDTTSQHAKQNQNQRGVTFLGSMLFTRCTSGARVVARGKTQEVADIIFKGYGAHCDEYNEDYITVAAAIGTREEEIDEFLERLETSMKECYRRNK